MFRELQEAKVGMAQGLWAQLERNVDSQKDHMSSQVEKTNKNSSRSFFGIEHYDVSMICSYIFIHFHALFSTKMT